MTLTGSQTQINTTLAAADNVVYRGVQDFNGSDTLTVTTSDTGIDPGMTGGATAEQDVDTVAINVTPVIDLTFLSATQGFIIRGDTASDRAGNSVASAGDVNGDGLADLIVGAFGGDDGGFSAGEAYVVFGKAAGFGTAVGGRQVIDLTSLSATNGLIIQGDTGGDVAGSSVASAGDVNGDGFADLIVGANGGDDGGVNAGEAYGLFGGAFGASDTPVTTTGTAAAEIFIGGRGNDSLSGGGGADVFRSGAGDDQLTISDLTFRAIDGGLGTDVLRLMGSGRHSI